MNIAELKSRFIKCRDYNPDDVNALMDFAKKAYIHNEIDIRDYRLLVRDLEILGAVVPDDNGVDSLIENS